MTTSSAAQFFQQRLLLRLAAERAGMTLRAGASAPLSRLAQWVSSQPERLLIALQDLRSGDPAIAGEIYAGYFAFCGKIVNAHGRSPFELAPPSPEWARALLGFGWLRHLHAADTALARANARALAKEFVALLGRSSAHPAWAPDVAARRTLSFLSQSPMLLQSAESYERRRFMAALSRGYWLLRRHSDDRRSGETLLTAAIAMTSYALCVQGGAPLLKHAVATLGDQLSLHILPDGVPIDRNPQHLLELFFDLLPLRQAFAARGLTPPAPLMNAIDRIAPALRLFRHGDGSLALFNGMGATPPERIAVALSSEDSVGQAIFNAPYAGYQRLEAGAAVLLMDAGAPPPPVFSRAAHAGCLSFEFSLGSERIVVNCGNPGPQRPELRAVARASAAHSTLTLDNLSSCLFAAQTRLHRWFGDEILSGPVDVPVIRASDANATSIQAAHDGYVRRFGLIHRRRLALRADGARLHGRDTLIAAPGGETKDAAYALRFHIHPSIAMTSAWDGAGVLLRTPGGRMLIFEAGGLPVEIEESIFFAAPEGPRACAQIVIHGQASEIADIPWSFSLASPRDWGEIDQ